MITKSLFIALFITSVPAFADTLAVGSVYFDSVQTLNEVIKLAAQRDNQGIAKLFEDGHISNQTGTEMDIVVLSSGATPESPAEFRFLDRATTYWTLTKNVAEVAKPIPNSTPPIPNATPLQTTPLQTTPPTESATATSTPTPAESATATSGHRRRHHESKAPFDDDNGRRIWHQVDGKWKWYPANKHHIAAKKALPPDDVPLVKP